MIPKDKILYMDEAGIDNRLHREKARAPRGIKVVAFVPGSRKERISIIGGWIQKKFVAPMTFKGGCNAEVLNTWLKEVLLPQVAPGTTIVMDNAAFHKSVETKKLIEEAKCFLKFLPTYSPDLNPIECIWHQIKSILRPLVQRGIEDLSELISKGLLIMQII